MERIQAAIQKAKEQRTDPGAVPARAAVAAPAGNLNGLRGRSAVPAPAWAQLELFEPDPQLLARNRVVTFADADPAHVFRLEILARDRSPLAVRPPGETEHFAVFVQNGGDGWSPTAEEQAAFVEEAPRTFTPAAGAWGRQGWTTIHLPAAKESAVRGACVLAWQAAVAAPPRKPARRPPSAKR